MEKVEEYTATSGITVQVRPLPGGAYRKLQVRAMEEHPDAVPPKKEIPVFDGTELVDDEDDPEYVAAQAAAEHAREQMVGEAILEWCVDLDLGPHEATIARLERKLGSYPKDEHERRVRFLEDWVFRTGEDYRDVTFLAISQALIDDKEVAERLQFFRREVAGDAGAEPDAPGAAEEVGVDVQPEVPGD